MSDEQLKKYWEMYTDSWKLFKEFSEPDETDEYWFALRDKAIELHEKHGTNLMLQIAVATILELNRVYKAEDKD